jgi:Uma2 family endonuclease
MATAALIPVSEYLATTYRPDRDFLDGVLKERNIGEQPHAHLQGILTRIFGTHRHDWHVRVLPEQRVQTSTDHFRIPDICVLRSSDPKDPIVRFAPLLCIEILSKDDSLSDLQERVNDYAGLGVAHIWVIDPWTRRAWLASTQGFLQPADGHLRIPDTLIDVSLADLFTELDEG